jgi:hypothetical protein
VPRDRQRVCLQDGLKLDLNRLIRQGAVRPGFSTGPGLLQWTRGHTGAVIGSVRITANLCDPAVGWLRVQASGLNQQINLVSCPRHFGGRQWYFICPTENKRVSVLWMLPGAKAFRSRQALGRKVAYRSQFLSIYDRGHAGKAKIKARLIGDLDPEEWELPPKPKWMRWRTYKRLAERFEVYDDMTYPDDSTLLALVAKLMRRVR